MEPLTPLSNLPVRPPFYRGITVSSCYIPMRDGIRLAADVWLPRNLPRGEMIPAILFQTRYWRSMELRPPFNRFLYSLEQLNPTLRQTKPLLTSRGYALVYVDVRGTGASEGVWRFPWDPETIEDAREVLDWLVSQPWCSGEVGGMGVSYLGMAAELLLATEHPALKAVVPMFDHPDVYTDISFPGGLFNQRFIQAWSDLDAHLDTNRFPPAFGKIIPLLVRGASPVGGEEGRQALQQAIQQHTANGQAYRYAKDLAFRDQIHPTGGYCPEDLCVIRHWEAIRSSRVPVLGWGSWMDAGTGDATLRRFMTFPSPQRAVVGAWCHGGLLQASPYRPQKARPIPGVLGQWQETLGFFDRYLRRENETTGEERRLSYYTMGAETWQEASSWPPPGVSHERWYFGTERRLTPLPPNGKEERDTYAVDFRATSGLHNRWWEQGVIEGKTVAYPDLLAQPAELLAYTSPPLDRDVEISGNPVVTLYVDSSEPDCAFYVYLEDLAPGGKALYLTEGQLRSIHRKISQEQPPYHLQAPYHTFCQADALPLSPGEVDQVSFGLLPVSVLIRQGHRLRVSIAGHDRDTFARIPAVGDPVWQIYRSRIHPSNIELPVRSSPVSDRLTYENA